MVQPPLHATRKAGPICANQYRSHFIECKVTLTRKFVRRFGIWILPDSRSIWNARFVEVGSRLGATTSVSAVCCSINTAYCFHGGRCRCRYRGATLKSVGDPSSTTVREPAELLSCLPRQPQRAQTSQNQARSVRLTKHLLTCCMQ